jgi:L-rhamnose mutarotase
MFKKIILISLFSLTGLFAQAGETWTVGESVYQVSTIDLEPNVDAQYLNQMKRTWENNMKVFKAEGIVEEYHIFKSINQYDGDFDLMLMVKYKNLAIFDSNPKNNKKWEKAQAKAREAISSDQQNQITGTFPKMRTILDQKMMREITFKK